MRFPLRVRLLILAAALFAAAPLRAIVELDSSFGVTDADYISLGAEYPEVGELSGSGSVGSGVLVADDWVLTAAHVAAAQNTATSVFTVGGNSYNITQTIIAPGYNSSPMANDIGLIKLASPVTNVAPAVLYTGSAELGVTATWTGIGQTGNGLTGENGSGISVLRGATNVVDAFGYSSNSPSPNVYLTPNSANGTFIAADFDDGTSANNTLSGAPYNSSATPTSLEGSLGASDSGGGVFANFGSGPVLIGINDFIAPGNGTATQYGALSGATRVSTYSTWIDSQIPEPATTALLTGIFAGLFAAARSRRKSRRQNERT
jgi:secreted trypsin-like serine protease